MGACEDVLDESVPAIQKKLDSLPDDTDAELRSALEESFTKLRTLSETECDTAPPGGRGQEDHHRDHASAHHHRDHASADHHHRDHARRPPPETTPKPKPRTENRRTTGTATANGERQRQNRSGGAQGRYAPEAGPGGGVGPETDEHPPGSRRPLQRRPPAGRRRHVDRVPGHRHRARALGGHQAAGRAPGRGRGVRDPLPQRGAGRGPPPAPQRGAGLRLRRGRRLAPPLHRHGVRGGALLRRPAARAQAAGHRGLGAHRRATPATGSTTPTAPAWSTATSSPATCWWPTRPAPPSWPTSASPRRPSRRA